MNRDPLAYEGEVPAEIRSTVRSGPVLLGLLVALALDFSLFFFVRLQLYVSIVSLLSLFIIIILLPISMLRGSKAGPVIALFHRRTEQVYVHLDDENLVVRLPGKREAYRPTKMEWIDDRTLNVSEGPTVLQLVFRNSVDASRIASEIRSHFPGVAGGSQPGSMRQAP